LQKAIASKEKQLGNETFRSRAPEKIIREMEEVLAGQRVWSWGRWLAGNRCGSTAMREFAPVLYANWPDNRGGRLGQIQNQSISPVFERHQRPAAQGVDSYRDRGGCWAASEGGFGTSGVTDVTALAFRSTTAMVCDVAFTTRAIFPDIVDGDAIGTRSRTSRTGLTVTIAVHNLVVVSPTRNRGY